MENVHLKSFLNQTESVNLVLSGGGTKGIAHIAVLDLLHEHGIKINAIAGSSAGALVASLFASGNSTQKILEFFRSTPLFRYTWLNFTKAGIFDSNKYEATLHHTISKNFEDLDIPIYVSATNIEEGKVEYFHQGELHFPVIASCAIPAIFSPVEINGTLYADGGIMDNFPITPFIEDDVPIIGSYVCRPASKSKKDLNSILKISNHSNSLLLFAGNRHKFDATAHTFIFPLGNYGPFDTKKIDEIHQKAQDHIRESQNQRTPLSV